MTSFLDTIPVEERRLIEGFLEPRDFTAGTEIWRQGSEGEGCVILDQGAIRLEVSTQEPDADAVLGFMEEGALVGELSLVDGSTRSAHAFAHTDVRLRVMSKEAYRQLSEQEPLAALELMRAMARDLSGKLRAMNKRFSTEIALGTRSPSVDQMVAQAVAAQPWLERRTDDELIALLSEIAGAVQEHAEHLAARSVDESGMGVVEHRIRKIEIATREVLEDLKTRFLVPSSPSPDEVVRIAKPAGVVFGLVPLTNPVSTFVFKSLIALASRNAVILSCHRRGLGVANELGQLIHAVLEQHGAPTDLVQWVRERASRQKTALFMQHPDVSLVLATGGPGMVRAAYASGTPAIGVGAGNAPVLIAPDADLTQVAEWITASKSFDNGLICGSENNLLVPASRRTEFEEALRLAGAYVLGDAERGKLEAAVLRDGAFHPRVVGQPATALLTRAGIAPDTPPLLLVVPARADERPATAGWLGGEKPAPIVSLFEYDRVDEAFALAAEVLEAFGRGHCAVIHTGNRDLALRYAKAVPASRVLVNQPASTACGGSGNGLGVSFTLGCGYWGGSSTNDNVGAQHLCNHTVFAPPAGAFRAQ